MTTLTRTAGAAGTITLTTKNTAGQLITPVSTPTAKWYTDTARTAGEVTLAVTGSGSTYTAAYTAAQSPPTPTTRYLKFSVEVATGIFDTDVDDSVSFVDATVSVDSTDYCTLDVLKASLGINDTADDDALRRAITATSRAIDLHTGTTFYTVTESRLFAPDCSTDVWVDPFVTTSGLVVAYGTDGTYPTTVTDVAAWPYNAPSKGGAYCRIMVPGGGLPTGYGRPTVQVTASWGYPTPTDDVVEACRIKAARLYRRKDTPEGVAGSGEFGVVRISRFEDPDVVALLAPYRPVGIA